MDGTDGVDRAGRAGPRGDLQRARTRLLLTLAYPEFEVHGLGPSREAVARALEAAERGDAPELVALAHDLRGLILVRGGDLRASLVELDHAVSLAEHLPRRERGSLFLNRGTVQLFRRDLPAARADLARGIELAAAVGDRRVQFKALLDRARVLMEAGLLGDAETSLAAAATLLAAEHSGQDLAETQLERARLALLQADWPTALAHATRARSDFRRRGSVGWTASADAARWQAELEAPGGAARVVRDIARNGGGAPGATPGSGPVDPQAVLLAAEAHLRVGRVEEAGALLARVGPARPDDPLSSRLHRHLVTAGVARAAPDPAAARRELTAGLTGLARAQARHHSLDLRTAMAVHGSRLAELDLRLALETRSPTRVFDSLERWRAMSHRRTAVTPPGDPALADLLTELRLVSEDLRSAPPEVAVEGLRRRRRRLH